MHRMSMEKTGQRIRKGEARRRDEEKDHLQGGNTGPMESAAGSVYRFE